MKEKYVIEWVSFRLAEGVEEAALIAASGEMQKEFLSRQKGFVRRDLVKAADGQWADVVYWENRADAEAAAGRAMEVPACLNYFGMLASANPNNADLSILHLDVMRSYS